ncbi:MAG: putative toxin-antitoxin system toxin component, PIN family [Desulfobacula sp.]|uniref:putative toxin-antitoxin system toxin component, PIN family n=1 Tax=Desulfobacula sp. TaxID=2593537 RepID=UPI0025B7C6A1|nr:putative toxin-antitoxin system toxin component, PIN family [Desulfobacula sp.]MCD4719611.1 putative toxin-antitoxin system toxin component, PIN family [Desulfobacula sp.]
MPILKAVIDTSVVVSVAFAKQGIARKMRDLIADNAFTMVTSKPILRELYEVLHYPHIVQRFNPSKQNIDEFVGMIIGNAMVTKNTYHIDGISLDPEDDMFIACALEGNADYIVSRDPHLRNIKHFQRIQIIDATTFVNKAG